MAGEGPVTSMQLAECVTTLARLEWARAALAEARTVEDLKEIRDQAEAVRYYLKQRDVSFEAQQDAAEIKLRAERELGKILKRIIKRGSHNTVLPEGVEPMQSSRWQLLVILPERQFESYIRETRASKAEVTSSGAMKLAKAHLKHIRQQKAKEARLGEPVCTVGDLLTLVAAGERFGTIYADPPWQYQNVKTRAAAADHYGTMTVEEIAQLPVGQLAAKESHLHLWTTDSFLEAAIGLLKGWGFERRQTFIWCKPKLGIGNYWRSNHEYLLLGIRGGLTFPDKSGIKSYLELPRPGRHSGKPAAVRGLIEQVSPAPRLELFGRETVRGWKVWGNDITKFLFDQLPGEGNETSDVRNPDSEAQLFT